MLANRLAILEHNNNIRGFEVWNSIQTRFGSVQVNEQGDVLLDASIWSRMSEAFNKLNSFENFQLALYHHHEENKTPLYNPVLMRDFAKENAPGLFDTILNSILRDDERLSKESRSLQEQHTVVLLHTLAYLRSQKTSALQKDLAIFLHSHGTTRSGLNSGPVLGYGSSPRTTDRHKKTIKEKCNTFLKKQVKKAVLNKHLIISLLDDYHNIYTVKMPTQLKLSIATHMASSLLDIFETGPSAIPLPQNRSKIHSSPSVVINRNQCICRGGIVLAHARSIVNSGMQSCNTSFLCQLPDEYRHIKPQQLCSS